MENWKGSLHARGHLVEKSGTSHAESVSGWHQNVALRIDSWSVYIVGALILIYNIVIIWDLHGFTLLKNWFSSGSVHNPRSIRKFSWFLWVFCFSQDGFFRVVAVLSVPQSGQSGVACYQRSYLYHLVLRSCSCFGVFTLSLYVTSWPENEDTRGCILAMSLNDYWPYFHIVSSQASMGSRTYGE